MAVVGTGVLTREEIGIGRSAHQLIEMFGEDAAIKAALRADQLLDEGALTGHREMIRIVAAIDELQRKPRGADARH